jgi:hypothetical protein
MTYTFISAIYNYIGRLQPFRIKRNILQINFNPISSIRLQALFDLNLLLKDTANGHIF